MASTVTELLRRRFGEKKGILPQGYTQLEYIQSANKSIIITTANSGDEFIVTAQGDYKIIKCAEAQLTNEPMPYDVATLVAERNAMRAEINELENIGGNEQ